MVYKLKNIFGKRLVSFALILSFMISNLYLPIAGTLFVPRAEAAGIPVWDIPDWTKKIIDAVAISIAQRMVDDMVRSTIKWANDGFDGNPAFITDPGRELSRVASGAIGDYIGNDTKLGFLCSPFQAQIKLSLVKQYSEEFQPQCTLEEIGVNLEDFYNDFDEGGWEAFVKMTQEEGNNPYGAYVAAKLDLESSIANQLALKTEENRINLGYKGYRDCIQRNVEPGQNTVDLYNASSNADRQRILDTLITPKGSWDPTKSNGECIKEGPVKTPGSVIKSQLDNILPSGLDRLVSIEHIEGLIGAFASGLLNRYVFGPKGLFSDESSTSATNEIIDIDNDDIPDGYDYDGDGELDICHHGQRDSAVSPSNDNCIGSKGLTNSPFFIPICQNVATTIRTIEKYDEFINEYDFATVNATTWMNRTITAQGAVDNLISTISRYEIMDYDPALFALGQYSGYLDDRIESLAEDGDLRGALPQDAMELSLLRGATTNVLNYLNQFEAAIGQCDNPDTEAIGAIPTPEVGEESSGLTLSCSPSKYRVRPDEELVWRMQSGYPAGTTYQWLGEDIDVEPTDSPEDLLISYESEGERSASVKITPEDGNPTIKSCSRDVMVTANINGLE